MNTLSRDTLIDAFIPTGSKRETLAGDASFRRYERLKKNNQSFVLMDAPPEFEDCRPFVAVANYLGSKRFSAPEILKSDFKNGFLLLEDLGDDTFNRVLQKNPLLEIELYRAAIDVLVSLHQQKPPLKLPINENNDYTLAPYDSTQLFSELNLFPEWYLPEIKGKREALWLEELKEIWNPLFNQVIPGNEVLTLKDYHADNLMWLPSRTGKAKVGLLDFQDALLGHPAYDLVSLLQDVRRPFRPGLENEMLDWFLSQTDPKNKEDFITAYQILGAQRNTKIIGIFTRLWRRDGKAEYPKMIPHVWSLLEQNLKHPALSQARDWFVELVPRVDRTRLLV